MNSRTLILHIGFEKTGTTSLQAYLRDNREMLRGFGVMYPVTGCTLNHWGLMAYALPPQAGDRIKWGAGLLTPQQSRAYQAEFAAALTEELATDASRLVVMSLEQLSSRLTGAQDVARLRMLFREAGIDEVRVVAYLRPQAEFVTSWYSTQLKSGQTSAPFRLPQPGDEAFRFLTYLPTLDLWSEVFGKDALHVVPFQRASLHAGNVIDDFLERIGAPAEAAGGVRAPDQNQSLDPVMAEVLRRLNPHIGPAIDERGPNPKRRHLRLLAEEVSGNERLTLSEQDASAFMELFSATNGEIARRYCGGGPLFESVRGHGTISFHEKALDLDQVFGGVARLLMAQQRRLQAGKKG